MNCPKCGAAARGKFCPECGTALETARCSSCQARLEPGARFCIQCGARVGAAANNIPWYIAGAAILALIVVILLPTFRKPPAQPVPSDAAPFAGGNTGVGTPPPLSADMRENADRLFNRVMGARESGDSASVKQFAPMGVMAYQNAGELDNDGLYHLSLLQTAAGDPAGSLATAKRILAASPDHLLALASAAEASAILGERSAARDYYQHFLRVLPLEKDKQIPEYLDHARVFPRLEAEAKQFLGGATSR